MNDDFPTDKPKTKEEIIEAYKYWGGEADPSVPNVWWVQGRCLMLKELPTGFCDVIEL